MSIILSLQESGRQFPGCLEFLPETLLSDIEGEFESSVCVCLKQCECESESYSNYLPLSLFLLRPEPAVSTHETRIMGQLFGEAYYGMRTQHISLPHSQTHTQTHSQTESYTITGDRNLAVPVLSDQNVMMLWIPQIPKWSGLFLTIDECCRQLPNNCLKCN